MPKANQFIPHARSTGLVITELDDEILVYDKARDKAHCLNQTAALVWKYSNGKRTVVEIAAAMENKLGSPVNEQIVWFALKQLGQDQLLQNAVPVPNGFAGITRREFVKKMGLAAAAVTVPIVMSIAAPQSALAVSCIPDGQPCVPLQSPSRGGPSATGVCCSGCCNSTASPGRTAPGISGGICGPCP